MNFFRTNLRDYLIVLFLIIISLVSENIVLTVKLMGWINIVLFFYYVYSTKQNHRLLSIYFIFLSMTYLFHFGQIVLFSVGMGDSINQSIISANVISDLPLPIVVQSIKFCTIAIFLLNMAAQQLFVRNKAQIVLKRNSDNLLERNELYLCRISGYALLILSIYFAINFDLSYIQKALSSGYRGLYSIDVNYGITDDMARLFKVGMILLIIGYMKKKPIATMIILFNLAYSIFKISITGQRGYEMIFIIVLVWIYFKLFSKLNIFKSSILLLFGVLTLSLTSLSVLYRDSLNRFDINTIITFAIYRNPILSSINEFGSTLITTQLFITYVPTIIDYGYGTSYFYSLITLLPNLGGYFSEILEKAYPNVILASYQDRGIGGSFIGEFYYNFGYFGVIFSYLFGFVIALLSQSAEKYYARNSYFKFSMCAIVFNIILWTIRDSFSIIPRNLLFAMFLPIVFYLLTKRKIYTRD